MAWWAGGILVLTEIRGSPSVVKSAVWSGKKVMGLDRTALHAVGCV